MEGFSISYPQQLTYSRRVLDTPIRQNIFGGTYFDRLYQKMLEPISVYQVAFWQIINILLATDLKI